MMSKKPYLIRALHEWISESGLTPYILVNATLPDCRVPEAYITPDGQIVLNIAGDVVDKLYLGNEAIECIARFSGIPTPIYIPIAAVMAIYSKEDNDGMLFADEAAPASAEKAKKQSKEKQRKEKSKSNPILKIVK